MTNGKRQAREWAAAWRAHGEDDGYFEDLYRTAGGDASQIPWADLEPNHHLVAWLDDLPTNELDGRRALVIGCGLGDDAEELARRGCAVTAFDVSPAAIDWARRRFPDSPADYCVADLFALPVNWHTAFDLVVEIYTLGVLPGPRRQIAYRAAADCVAPGGRLLVICRRRNIDDETDADPGGPPWQLTPTELRVLERADFRLESWDEILDMADVPPVERLRVVWRVSGRRFEK